ncbi:hypothetical protein [Mycobacterium sp. E796]|uniref:hypothetical protein n=1 Tax=Mycobacterium sp. E796 TaxID=1834151 RepID=UPI000B090121|nr:hypothetical protein [Mycobacterium sp. E796]
MELDDYTLEGLSNRRRYPIEQWARRQWPQSGTAAGIERYVWDSAFVANQPSQVHDG